MKKTLSLLTALAMLLVLMPTFAIAEEAAEEPIVITAFMDGDPTLDYSQNYSLQYLEEKTGVRIDPTGYVFSNQEAPTQKQLLLASGDYPDSAQRSDRLVAQAYRALRTKARVLRYACGAGRQYLFHLPLF